MRRADAGLAEEGTKNFLRSNISSLALGEAYARGLKEVLEGCRCTCLDGVLVPRPLHSADLEVSDGGYAPSAATSVPCLNSLLLHRGSPQQIWSEFNSMLYIIASSISEPATSQPQDLLIAKYTTAMAV